MTIPRNKRRTIIVNGIKWEYCISNFVSIHLKNLLTKEQYSWYFEVKPKWGTQLTPKDVEELITKKNLAGIDWKKI